MKTYKCTFKGRVKDAIGSRHWIVESIKANSRKEANLKLYDKFEHLSNLKIIQLDCDLEEQSRELDSIESLFMEIGSHEQNLINQTSINDS